MPVPTLLLLLVMPIGYLIPLCAPGANQCSLELKKKLAYFSIMMSVILHHVVYLPECA